MFENVWPCVINELKGGGDLTHLYFILVVQFIALVTAKLLFVMQDEIKVIAVLLAIKIGVLLGIVMAIVSLRTKVGSESQIQKHF